MYTNLVAMLLLLMKCHADDYYYQGLNVTRTTLSPIVAYRSSLTLDWLAAAESRQRSVADMYGTHEGQGRVFNTECISYPRPSPGKIGRYMLELLKHLEGDNGTLIAELIQSLKRSKMLVETSAFEAEPNLDALVQTPEIMMGEPYLTFPRLLSLVWMSVTDPSSVKKHGWCPISKVSQFLITLKPSEVAKHMRALDLLADRARFIMEDFIHQVTPPTVYQPRGSRRKTSRKAATKRFPKTTKRIDEEELHLYNTTEGKFDYSTKTTVRLLRPVAHETLVKSNVGVRTSSMFTVVCMYVSSQMYFGFVQ